MSLSAMRWMSVGDGAHVRDGVAMIAIAVGLDGLGDRNRSCA